MFTRIVFAGLLLTVGFAGGLVLTGRLQSAAFSEARHAAPAAGTASEPATAVEQTAAARHEAAPVAGGGPDFTEVAARTTGAVVNISSMQEVRRRNPLFNDPFFSQFFGDEGQYSTQRGISAGSGVIISPNGYVLTNNHVVGDNSTGVSVILADKREKKAKLVGVDPVTDLALLKIDGQNLPTIPWGDSSQLKVAEWVLAIGNPYQLGQTVTLGIVSGTNRNYSSAAGQGGAISSVVDYIQTDAAINPGNSGGALINRRGELVGINTWIYSESGGYQGIGFAVPTNVARHIADELMKNGEVRRGTIGYVQLTELTPELAREVGLKQPKGLVVWRMSRTSPAYQAGLRPGDVVDSVNGQSIDTRGQFDRTLFEAQIGSVLRLGVIRDGKPMELRVPIVSDTTRRPQGVA